MRPTTRALTNVCSQEKFVHHLLLVTPLISAAATRVIALGSTAQTHDCLGALQCWWLRCDLRNAGSSDLKESSATMMCGGAAQNAAQNGIRESGVKVCKRMHVHRIRAYDIDTDTNTYIYTYTYTCKYKYTYTSINLHSTHAHKSCLHYLLRHFRQRIPWATHSNRSRRNSAFCCCVPSCFLCILFAATGA